MLHTYTLCQISTALVPDRNLTESVPADGNETVFLNDFQRTVEEASVVAAARVVLAANVIIDEDTGDCIVESIGEPCVSTGRCAGERQDCRDEGNPDIEGILPCCNRGYDCTRVNSQKSKCQPRGAMLPSFYDGTIEQPSFEAEPCAEEGPLRR